MKSSMVWINKFTTRVTFPVRRLSGWWGSFHSNIREFVFNHPCFETGMQILLSLNFYNNYHIIANKYKAGAWTTVSFQPADYSRLIQSEAVLCTFTKKSTHYFLMLEVWKKPVDTTQLLRDIVNKIGPLPKGQRKLASPPYTEPQLLLFLQAPFVLLPWSNKQTVLIVL